MPLKPSSFLTRKAEEESKRLELIQKIYHRATNRQLRQFAMIAGIESEPVSEIHISELNNVHVSQEVVQLNKKLFNTKCKRIDQIQLAAFHASDITNAVCKIEPDIDPDEYRTRTFDELMDKMKNCHSYEDIYVAIPTMLKYILAL